MKHLISKILVVGILMVTFSTQNYAQSIGELKSQINEINSELINAILKNDNATMLSYYTDDAISLPSYEPMIKGIESLKAHGEKNKKSPMKMNNFTLTTKNVFSEGNLVVEVGTYNLSMEMDDAPEPIKDNGKYVTIFEKQSDGSLKIKLDMWNTNMNPWMQKQEMSKKTKCSVCGKKKSCEKCKKDKSSTCKGCKKKSCKKNCKMKKQGKMKEATEKAKQIEIQVEKKM